MIVHSKVMDSILCSHVMLC